MSSHSRRKKHLYFTQMPKLSRNMQFDALAVIYMAKDYETLIVDHVNQYKLYNSNKLLILNAYKYQLSR